MPIVTRLPEADVGDVAATEHPVAGSRPGGDTIGTAAPPSGVLLPSGGTPAPGPVPAPTRALALDALRLLRCLRDPARVPARWAEPAFGREVDLVRAHLAPVRSRAVLAASFEREAFHVVMDRHSLDSGPVRVAYALRWLELGTTARRAGAVARWLGRRHVATA
jgi:hypothetical protein